MSRSATIILLFGLLRAGGSQAQTTAVKPDSASRSAPATSGIVFVKNPGRITTLDTLLSAHRGRVVYIDFWGTWCVPCRKEMPYSARLREKFKGRPVDFLYVAYENSYTAKAIANWKATVAQLNIKGRHFMMNPEFEGALTEYLEVDSYPRYVIIDRYGEILNAHAARPSQTATVAGQLEEALER